MGVSEGMREGVSDGRRRGTHAGGEASAGLRGYGLLGYAHAGRGVRRGGEGGEEEERRGGEGGTHIDGKGMPGARPGPGLGMGYAWADA